MADVKNMKEYHGQIQEALDDKFLRATLDKFAVEYKANRVRIFDGMDVDGLVSEVADIKDNAAQHMMELFEQFKAEAEKRGVHVHLASTGAEANRIIAKIAKENNCKNIIKSKSMTAEEIHLNGALEKEGFRVVETDLGEWIIQLRHEGPSHMVMPAIHLSRYQVADLFTDVTKVQQDREDIQKLVKVARKELRSEYVNADMGISGANFAVAEAGLIGTVTNEGNLRLVTTMPRVHVVLAGLEKLIPTVADALKVLQVLPRNATAQAITSYITWIAGANECATGPDGRKEMHIVFLDNGRLKIAQDPAFKDILRCVRCGACANVCPVYRLIGGHKMGYVYIGAVGLALTYLYHGADKARALVQNCIGCESCKNVCSAGIDLPRITREIRSRIVKSEGNNAAGSVMSMVMKDRDRFHSLLKFIKFSQKPLTVKGGRFIRHLPAVLMGGDQSFRQLPALAPKSFRQLFEKVVNNPAQPKFRVAIFSGSIYGHTENAADILACRLAQKGVKNIALYDVSHTDVSYLVSEAFRCSHLVFASATYNGEIYTPMEDFIRDLKSHGLRSRSVALIENGTWAAQSARLMTGILDTMKDMRVMEGTVTLKSSVKEAQRRSLEALADKIAEELLH